MANEATVNCSLQIKTGNIDYKDPGPSQYRVAVTGAMGPTPGAVVASIDGTDVDLTELTTPGLVTIINYDSSNFVTVGKFDDANNFFDPVLEIGPGEKVVVKLSRYLSTELVNTGTATGVGSTLRIKADRAPCNVYVGAFEK